MKEGAVDEGMSRLGVNTTCGLHTHTHNANERAPDLKSPEPSSKIKYAAHFNSVWHHLAAEQAAREPITSKPFLGGFLFPPCSWQRDMEATSRGPFISLGRRPSQTFWRLA